MSATKSKTPPSGTWTAANNGAYTINMLPTGVLDTSENNVSGGMLGSFNVNIAGGATTTPAPVTDSAIPTATLLSAPAVTASGQSSELFTIDFASTEAPIYRNSFGNGDVLITGPDGFSTNARYVSTTATHDQTPMTATYAVDAPSGQWTAADNGTYTVSMQQFGVLDIFDRYVAPVALGSFTVGVS
jgi:hypothetical protein